MAIKKDRETEFNLRRNIVLVALLAIGLLVFLSRMTLSVDMEQHQARLNALRAVNSLDLDLNRAFTQTRVTTIAEATDDRKRINQQLGAALEGLETGPTSLRGLNPQVSNALGEFLETVESKFGLGFDFEARSSILTQRLINNLDAIPAYSDWLLREAPAQQGEAVETSLKTLKATAVQLGINPSATTASELQTQLEGLEKIGARASPAYGKALGDLRRIVEGAIADKAELGDKLKAFVNLPTAPKLEALESAYMGWHNVQVVETNRYRMILAGYTGVLLLALAFLGLRLLQSHAALDRANAGLRHANLTLESQVAEQTKDLRKTLGELRSSQAQLVQSEKMASLGQMVAGVAHEINTPLGYARSNAEIVRTSLADIRQLCGAQGRALGLLGSDTASEEEVATAMAEAEESRSQTNAEELMGDLDSLLADTDHGLVQIAELVSSLKDFSRVDRSQSDLFDVNGGIESALKICNNQLKMHVEVVRDFGSLPQIECSPSQLNQVFLNLFTNAAQAIEGSGQLFISTAASATGVTVRVRDTGSGMSEAVQKRIFEPFYTTKAIGKGTGLGLSIVFRIIEQHGGRIEVKSAPGKGSEFIVQLPLKQPRAPLAANESAPPAPQALAA